MRERLSLCPCRGHIRIGLSGAGVAVAVPELATTPQVVSAGLDPRLLPPASGPALGATTAQAGPAAVTVADFGPLEGSSARGNSRFDSARSQAVARSTFSTEYLNPDGSRSLARSAQPLNVRDAAGVWQVVDTSLVVDAVSGRARAKQHPMNASLAGSSDDPNLVSVEVDGTTVSLALEGAAERPAEVSGSETEYSDVAADTDLRYQVTAGAVKESIVVKRRPQVGGSSWRFRLQAGGLTPSVREDGSVALTDAAGAVLVRMPPIETWDASGTDDRLPAMTGGTYSLVRAGTDWVLTVSVDESWLRNPARVFPVTVDPTLSYGADLVESHSWDGVVIQDGRIRVGNSRDSGDRLWRGIFHFDNSPLFGKWVTGARMDFSRDTGVAGTGNSTPVSLFEAVAFDFAGYGAHLGDGTVTNSGSISDARLTKQIRDLVDAQSPHGWFLLAGAEGAGVYTLKQLYATLWVDYTNPPGAPAMVGPVDNSVITNLTPRLSVSAVTDPDGEPVKYCFKVATGPDARSGVVVDSGCLTDTSWMVPAGVLQDGVAYTWVGQSTDGQAITTPPWVGHFKVDQRIGDHGPAPVDTVGAVSVNLVNGNVSTSAPLPSFTTVGGSAGVSLSYNSLQQNNKGLRASYFQGTSPNGDVPVGTQPVLVRTEPQVNVDWDVNSPHAPALGVDHFLVRWEGYVTVPVTGSYQFAGRHDDGLSVWVNNTQVYNQGCCRDVTYSLSTSVSLTAGVAVPIKVELQELTYNANLRLFARTSDGTTVPSQIVPATWLSTTDTPVLPRGWTLSADLDGSGATYRGEGRRPVRGADRRDRGEAHLHQALDRRLHRSGDRGRDSGVGHHRPGDGDRGRTDVRVPLRRQTRHLVRRGGRPQAGRVEQHLGRHADPAEADQRSGVAAFASVVLQPGR